MSSQKGNTKRTRPQKHQNKSGFKNDLHDKTKTTKIINSLVISGVCGRCKDIIDWRIKYKKYKPLSQLKTCVKCHQKAVKMAYSTMCDPCASEVGCCVKCGDKTDIVIPPQPTTAEASSLHAEFQRELRSLSEKKRRKFLRLLGEGKLKPEDISSMKLSVNQKEDELEEDSGDEGNSAEEVRSDMDNELLNPTAADELN